MVIASCWKIYRIPGDTFLTRWSERSFLGGGGGGIVEDHESLESSPRDGQLRLREGEVSKLRIRVAEREGVLAGFSAGGAWCPP